MPLKNGWSDRIKRIWNWLVDSMIQMNSVIQTKSMVEMNSIITRRSHEFCKVLQCIVPKGISKTCRGVSQRTTIIPEDISQRKSMQARKRPQNGSSRRTLPRTTIIPQDVSQRKIMQARKRPRICVMPGSICTVKYPMFGIQCCGSRDIERSPHINFIHLC